VIERIYGNCPACNYSAYPNEILGRKRKHFWPHSLECVRCGFRTETALTWEGAREEWNKERVFTLSSQNRAQGESNE